MGWIGNLLLHYYYHQNVLHMRTQNKKSKSSIRKACTKINRESFE